MKSVKMTQSNDKITANSINKPSLNRKDIVILTVMKTCDERCLTLSSYNACMV